MKEFRELLAFFLIGIGSILAFLALWGFLDKLFGFGPLWS